MKKVMIAALALTMIGGAAFAQKTAPKAAAKQETKQEAKSDDAKATVKKKKVTAKVKKADAAHTAPTTAK